MIGQLFTIARNAFVESIRQPIFLIVLLLSGALQILNTWSTAYSMGFSDSSEVSRDNKLLLDILLASVFVFGTLLSCFVATAVLSREIESKTALTVISKPISRPTIILGKYLGVCGALLLAVAVMAIGLLMGIRHGVMETARDGIDYPVVVFTTAAVLGAIGLAGWTNFFYGWSFPQTASIALAAGIGLAYTAVLFINPDWEFQPLAQTEYLVQGRWLDADGYESRYFADPATGGAGAGPIDGTRVEFLTFKPQIALACTAIAMGLFVLAAVATALSARLGQVMTIVGTAGVFVLGLLSNHLVGRFAYENDWTAKVQFAVPDLQGAERFERPGDAYRVTFETEPNDPLPDGTVVYYGEIPNGFGLESSQPIVTVQNLDQRDAFFVLAEEIEGLRPPRDGDYVFLQTTEIRPAAAIAHAVLPNLQHFWLLDAVSQNNPIPAGHIGLLAGYAAAQVAGFLAIGIVLFQRRDVG